MGQRMCVVVRKRAFRRRLNDRGQVSVFVVLALALFLLGFMGFAVDMTNLWFHRQMAQGAADAACQAGIMDVLITAQGGVVPGAGFTPGTNFNCASLPASVPCRYAALNGYDGAGLVADTPSNEVAVSFPSTVPGITPPPAAMAPVPFLRVDVVDRVPLTFASLITGTRTSDVRAFAECGLQQARAPIPIIVLNPTCSRSLNVSGSANVRIIGGPTKSIQVNSSNTCAAALSSSGCITSSPTTCSSPPPPGPSCAPSNAAIDLTQGGPSFIGSNFGVFGGPNQWGGGFWTGPNATWASPASPIADPYASLPPLADQSGVRVISTCSAPTSTDPAADYHLDPYPRHGCPDQTQACWHYRPGRYTVPIVVKNVTAIFDPGLYEIRPSTYSGPCYAGLGNVCPAAACTDIGPITNCRVDFAVATNGIVRMATSDLDGNGLEGAMFYLSSGVAGQWGSVAIVQGAGTPGGRTVDNYVPAGGPTSRPASCAGNPFPANPPLPASLPGNVLLGVCGGTYGDVTVDPSTNTAYPIRGMLFFQDRANNQPTGQANMQGGGGLLLAGTLYFHNCPGSPACQPYPTDFNGLLQLQGTPGSDTRVVGSIVTDSLNLAGNAAINMVLDPNRVRIVLKATLLR